MKRPYMDEIKRLAELEKAVNPNNVLTVELPDGRIKQVYSLDYWEHRDEWAIHGDQSRGSEKLYALLTMCDQAYRDDHNRRDLKGERDAILKMVFGDTIAKQIIKGETEK